MTQATSGLAALLALFAAGAAAAETGSQPDPRDQGPDTIDVSSYPDDMKEAYALFKVRCSKCHSLARPINARIAEPSWWKQYVRKMMRKPGSGINQDAGKTIYRFLEFYATQKKSGRDKTP